MSGIEGGAEPIRKAKAQAEAEIISIETGKPIKVAEAKKKTKRASKRSQTYQPAVGILGKKEGVPTAHMKVGTGILDKGYRQAVDSGPTMRDVVRARKAHGKTTPKGEENIMLRTGLSLGTVDVLPKTNEEAVLKKKSLWRRIIGSVITLGAAVSPLPYKISAEAHQEHLRVEQNREDFREQVEAFNAHLREEQLPSGVQHVRPAEISRIMHDALEARGSALPVHPLMSRIFGQDGETFTIDSETEFDFDPAVSLESLWSYKNAHAISSGRPAEEGARTIPPEYRRLLEEGQLWRSSLDAQLADAYSPSGEGESITQILTQNIDWEAYAQAEGIPQHAELLQQLASQLDPMMVYAIFMAEIIPADGLDAMALTDLSLRIGGARYMLGVPSLYDDLESKGFSQMTIYPFGRYGGVSAVAPFLRSGAYAQLQIPEGMAVDRLPNTDTPLTATGDLRLQGELPTRPFKIDSLRAEEVLTLLNVVKSLSFAMASAPGRAALTYIAENHLNQRLLEYVDMAHNNPPLALDALEKWGRHAQADRPLYLDMNTSTRPGRIARGHGERGSADYRAMVTYFDQRSIDSAVNRGGHIRLRP